MFFSFLILTRHPFSDDCKTIQKNHRGSADYSVLTVFIVPDENSDSPLLLVTSKYPKVGAFLCPISYTNKFVTYCYEKSPHSNFVCVGLLFSSWAILDYLVFALLELGDRGWVLAHNTTEAHELALVEGVFYVPSLAQAYL